MKPWKAPISDTKALKITQKPLFYKAFTVRDQEVGCSNHLTPTSWQCRQLNIAVCAAVFFYFVSYDEVRYENLRLKMKDAKCGFLLLFVKNFNDICISVKCKNKEFFPPNS